ncbi:hypothetical protein QBC34DRAFT_421680 [Podospora aff. communis PSN243]|uniref:Uncharacterized protein n=1 Tax=Podospora aff. communis PSN243 TaxID=3040156 RepID=A0AAV9H0E9_9PEZI|nr:hypothetical protein QBC34DRAFT_421680 [Podospora aff. communis PSN243]
MPVEDTSSYKNSPAPNQIQNNTTQVLDSQWGTDLAAAAKIAHAAAEVPPVPQQGQGVVHGTTTHLDDVNTSSVPAPIPRRTPTGRTCAQIVGGDSSLKKTLDDIKIPVIAAVRNGFVVWRGDNYSRHVKGHEKGSGRSRSSSTSVEEDEEGGGEEMMPLVADGVEGKKRKRMGEGHGRSWEESVEPLALERQKCRELEELLALERQKYRRLEEDMRAERKRHELKEDRLMEMLSKMCGK